MAIRFSLSRPDYGLVAGPVGNAIVGAGGTADGGTGNRNCEKGRESSAEGTPGTEEPPYVVPYPHTKRDLVCARNRFSDASDGSVVDWLRSHGMSCCDLPGRRGLVASNTRAHFSRPFPRNLSGAKVILTRRVISLVSRTLGICKMTDLTMI